MTEGNNPGTGKGSDRVREIFSSIAREYDKVNTVISFGQIGRWRRKLVSEMNIPERGSVLDLGCGTGELTRLIAGEIDEGKVCGVDLTPEMIEIADARLPKKYRNRVDFAVGKGEELELDSNSFDVATSAFTLRNVEYLPGVISELKRVVKPGGKIYSLELSKPQIPVFREIYFFYFNRILPTLGKLFQGNRGPYKYLTESLKKFPNQDKLKKIFQEAGLTGVSYKELFGGIAAIHRGKKRET
ncbi:ubiquinone/menaquinone biosynthesis methyltransferase [Candidatus Bipolaricaulota bacterium]|nr:ubiquinone/menaquinone biosynthesis methyltransferase [Candidatus Bipolaricaulota bacterium]